MSMLNEGQRELDAITKRKRYCPSNQSFLTTFRIHPQCIIRSSTGLEIPGLVPQTQLPLPGDLPTLLP